MGLLLRFNLIAVTVFLIGLAIAQYLAIRDIRERVDADMAMTTALADYLIESQTMRLWVDFQHYGLIPTEKALNRLFQLERLQYLKYLDIQFISPDGQILDSNEVTNAEAPVTMPGWLFDFLSNLLQQQTVIKPVNVAGQNIGDIKITNNINNEIDEIWHTSQEMILPLLLVFLAGSILIALLASLIVNPAEKLLRLSRKLAETPPVKRRVFAGVSGIFSAGHQLNDIGRQLQNHNQQLRELNDQMLTMHESERKRLSAELHDEIGQHLTAIRFDTATIASAVDLAEAKQAGQSIDNINRQLTDIIRSMLQRLRPPALDSVGLAASLRELIDDWQQRHPEHHFNLQIDGDLGLLQDPLKLTVYRAVQEALTNIARHAGDAVRVDIHIQQKPQQLLFSIKDDGCGCDFQKTKPGFGLLAMRERIEALAGEFTVLSSPGAGLTVTVSIPL